MTGGKAFEKPVVKRRNEEGKDGRKDGWEERRNEGFGGKKIKWNIFKDFEKTENKNKNNLKLQITFKFRRN